MLCNLRRSLEEGWFLDTYCLDVKLDLTDDERALVERHGVGPLVVFDSAQREEYERSVEQHLQASNRAEPGWFDSFEDILSGTAKSFYHIAAAAFDAGLAALTLRLTVRSLIDGTRIEGSAQEVLAAEHLIRESAEYLKQLLLELAHFDGSEAQYEV